MNKPIETAWMYCRECKELASGRCTGAVSDYEIKDGEPPCKKYSWNEELENEPRK